MNDALKIPPPIESITGDTVSIHMSYIRRDIDEIKANQNKSHEEIRRILEELKNGYVTLNDFTEHLKKDDDHENRIRSLERNMWKWVGASSVLAGSIGFITQFIIK